MDWNDLRGGDVVEAPDGVLMTVNYQTRVDGIERVSCVWFDAQFEQHADTFDRDFLKLRNAHQYVVLTGHPPEESVQLYFDEDQHGAKSFDEVRAIYSDFEMVEIPKAGYWRVEMGSVINEPAFKDLTHPWLVLRFDRENRTVAFFAHLTEAVQFKLLTV